MRRRYDVCTLMAVLVLAVGCTSAVSTPSDGTPVVGEWNGPHASLTLTESGGTIEYDCAHGGLRAPVEPDAAGQFTVVGVHFRDHGGPVRIGEVPDSAPARYVGRVQGDQLTLRVIVGAETLGPFALKRGGTSRLMRCL
jgi:hypothetical protein